jgi:hypothetical protein
MTRCDVTGVEQTVRASKQFFKVINTNLDVALHKCALAILKKSQVYVPVETGALKASGRVSDSVAWKSGSAGLGARSSVMYGDDPTGEFDPLPYGRADLTYAATVHENPIPYHAPPTCYKYLERAVKESKPVCNRILGRQMILV